MQTQAFSNSTVATRPSSSKCPASLKYDPFSSSNLFDLNPLKEYKKGAPRSMTKHGDVFVELVYPRELVIHEDFPKLNILQENMARWEHDITLYTGKDWRSKEQKRTDVAFILRCVVRDLQRSLEMQEDSVTPMPVVRRGEDAALDREVDRLSFYLCQECSDMFICMRDFLVINLIPNSARRWRYDKVLDVMCHAVSPFDEYELDHSPFLAACLSESL